MIDYKSVSLANQVYERIENNILNGVYEQGEIISEARLSEELGVSRTPIREALARLQSDRLIGESPAGTVVLGITERDVEDMFQVKRHMEPLASRWAVQRISDEELSRLKDVLEQQEFYGSKENVEKVRNLDTDFHDVIYRACGSPVFQSILSPIHHKLMKYRKASLDHKERLLHSIEEHRALYEAFAARDEKKVEELMLIHVEHAFEGIMKGSN